MLFLMCNDELPVPSLLLDDVVAVGACGPLQTILGKLLGNCGIHVPWCMLPMTSSLGKIDYCFHA